MAVALFSFQFTNAHKSIITMPGGPWAPELRAGALVLHRYLPIIGCY